MLPINRYISKLYKAFLKLVGTHLCPGDLFGKFFFVSDWTFWLPWRPDRNPALRHKVAGPCLLRSRCWRVALGCAEEVIARSTMNACKSRLAGAQLVVVIIVCLLLPRLLLDPALPSWTLRAKTHGPKLEAMVEALIRSGLRQT